MRIDAFRPAEEFKQHMDKWIERFRNAKPANGYDKIIIPGDPEREAEIKRMKEGIPIFEAVVDDLKNVGTKNLMLNLLNNF